MSFPPKAMGESCVPDRSGAPAIGKLKSTLSRSRFRYWELVIKRIDIGVMLVVASTSIASDDRLKLLLFALISGMQLAVTAWLKPYGNSQAEVLDFLEFVLLTSRFVLFTTVAILLMFLPSREIVWVWSAACLHIILFESVTLRWFSSCLVDPVDCGGLPLRDAGVGGVLHDAAHRVSGLAQRCQPDGCQAQDGTGRGKKCSPAVESRCGKIADPLLCVESGCL